MKQHAEDEKRKQIRTKLAEQLINFNLSAEQIKILAYGLEDASGVQSQIGHLEANKAIGFKEVKDEVTRLQKALIKLNTGKGTTAAALKTIAATVNALPESVLYELSPRMQNALRPAERDFETVVMFILAGLGWYTEAALLAVNEFLDDINAPGKGGARVQAQKYRTGIRKLAYWFNQAAPDNVISANEDSIFSVYVKHWLELETGQIIEPKRHIRNSLLS
jgi:hypothetical protein